MKFITPKNISKLIMILPILGIIITAILISSITLYTIKDNFKKEKEKITQEFMHDLKITTKKRVELAYNVIDALYQNNKNDKNSYKKTIKIIQKVLDKMRWEEKGYIFVFDKEGNAIFHINKKFINTNRWNIERNGVKIVQLLIKSALNHPKGTYVKYLAYNPDGKPLEKISFVKVYKPLNIIIGNGVYLDYLNKELLQKQQTQDKLLNAILFKIILIFIIIVILMSIIMYIFASILKNLFKKYEKEIMDEKHNLFLKANFDLLTGLHNRNYFLLELKELLSIMQIENRQLVLLFIDIDHFKEINDSLGHQYGDQVLKTVANRLKESIKDTDIASRFGGDEFLILLNDITTIEEIIDIAQNILNKLKEPIILNNTKYYISGSIGISIAPTDTTNLDQLIKYADTAMYKAKKHGKDRFEFYTKELGEKAKNRLVLKNSLYNALENNEFEVYYQPQIDKNNHLIGAEALIRWNHPQKGLISPIEFIPLSIEIGLIDKIDIWVIEQTIIQHKIWQEKYNFNGIISCNITIYQIEKNDFSKELEELINKYSFNPKYLNLEITEESVMKHPDKSIEILHKIQNLGVDINIDDFGTGYSSLAYLKKLPISKLKIDRSFIKDIPNDKDDMVIAKTIIDLAKNLNLDIIAEGVEIESQKEFIFSHGSHYFQGYLSSPPITAKEFEEKFLKDTNGSK